MIEEKIGVLLERKFREPEFEDCFLLEIKAHPNNKVEVFLDSDEGITFGRCQQISRYLEGFIDEEGWLGEKYVLEVGSPGATRPLELARQYPKHIGRDLKVKLADGQELKGKLVKADENGISLEVRETRKVGKKKKHLKTIHDLPFDQIAQARVQLSF